MDAAQTAKRGTLPSEVAHASARRLDPVVRRYLIQIGALTALALVAAYSVAYVVGAPTPHLASAYAVYCLLVLLLIGAAALFGLTIRLMLRGDPSPVHALVGQAKRFLALPFLVTRVLPILLVFNFLSSFTVLKVLIPSIHGFGWDAAFSDADRLIFRVDPWRLTHAVIGPAGTAAIDYIYGSWLPVFAAVVFYHSVFAQPDRQRRFFLSFYAVWIVLGLFAAIAFSSAGPCFLELLNHPYDARYAGLFPVEGATASPKGMQYLAHAYRTPAFEIGSGISAMPSVHVAIAFLYVLTARKPVTIALSIAYCFVIFVGSVHLGWHYAVDGIAGMIGTAIIWYAAGRKAAPKRSSV